MFGFKHVLKNISYTLSSNLLTFMVSVIVTLLLPKVLGITSYSYYQLYLFYVSYVGFLHFGWCDGIYLRYGGCDYNQLDKPTFRGQFYSFLFFQIIMSLIFFVVINLSINNFNEKKIILYFTIINMVILNIRTFILMVVQATNRMKDYSIVIIIDRVIFVGIVIFLVLQRVDDYKKYILADIVSKCISLLISLAKTKEINLPREIKFSLIETSENIKVGINLMLANIASILIIGIVRFGIQSQWTVELFGKISLSLSLSNMLMVFIGAVSLAVFPILKRTDETKHAVIYKFVKTNLMLIIFVLLLAYFPMIYLLRIWLPQYNDSLYYMSFVFPMIVFESKVSLLTNTYLKVLRKEKDIFKINVITAFLSLSLTFFTVYILKNIVLSVLSIVVLLAFRSAYSEVVLSKYLKVNVMKDIILELIIVSMFIFFVNRYSSYTSFILYLFILILYIFLKRRDIKKVYSELALSGGEG